MERHFPTKNTKHLVVSKAMKEYMHKHYHINEEDIHVFYDMPCDNFRRLSPHEIIHSLREFNLLDEVSPHAIVNNDRPLMEQRSALIVSSTSWTPDEDFGLLFEALKRYDSFDKPGLPSLVVIVTGMIEKHAIL